MSLPQIDDVLLHRVSVKVAARYVGCSMRYLQREIHEGRIRAIDVSRPGSTRASWSIAVSELRRFISSCELRAEERIEQARAQGAHRAREPETSA